MIAEDWVTILAATAAVLLGGTAVAGGAARIRGARHNDLLVTTGRALAVIVLAIGVALGARVDGSPSPADVRLVATSLVLAGAAVHLTLTLTSRLMAGLWPVDALLSGLLGVILFIARGGVAVDCAESEFSFFLAWALYLFGGGALLVSGGAGATLLGATSRQQRTRRWAAQEVLVAALLLSLVALGAGLLVGAWWAWQTTGKLLGSDPRVVWMAVAWVVAAMALAAGEMERRWVATFAVIATATTIFGLLIVPDLFALWGG